MNNPQNDEKRFVFFYLNRNEPEKIRRMVSAHVHYWKTAPVKAYQGGPLGDRTGGMISFFAPSLQEATDIILQDPFILEDLITEKWIKDWHPE
jgi:hypothetical protein